MAKVCIVRLTYYPWQRNVRRNAEALVSQGYEVDVICLRKKGEKKREIMNGVNLYRLPLEHYRGRVLRYLFEYSVFFLQVSLKLGWLSLKKRYDVVEVHTMPDFLVFTTLFPRLLGAKVMLYMFEDMPRLFTSTFKVGPNHIGARILRLLERASAGYAHRVVVADGIPYKLVLESHGVASEKIAVVLNVPDEEVFNIKSVPAPQDGDRFRLIVVSHVLRRHGVQTLIKAVPLLLKDIPQLKVDVVGESEYKPELEKLSHDLGVEEYVDFIGYVPHESVPALIAQADVGVAPMIDDVGLPNKLYEYFALGKPSVASALPSLVATFNSDCVLYFQPGDERDLADRIVELYHSPEKRASLATNGQVFYQRCQWQIMKYEYLKLYEELLA